MDAATVPTTRPAPELPPSLEWLNVSGPLQLASFRGGVCALVFFAGFTYLELIDKALYLNHYYLVSLLAGMLAFTFEVTR